MKRNGVALILVLILTLGTVTLTVFAGEPVISPLADDHIPVIPTTTIKIKPNVSFGQLTSDLIHTQILGASTDEPAPTPPQETPTPRPRVRKSRFTIALLGDSMMDTLGTDTVEKHLLARYPGTSFSILNYGVGATNIDYGLERVTHDYTYLGTPIPALVSRNPDIVVIESFGYNPYPYDVGAMDRHWLQLARIIDILKAQVPGVKIVIGATIAPSSKTFGDGAAGLSFDPIAKHEHVVVVKRYLENTVRFAQSQKLPLANAYHPSLQADGDGKEAYINEGDHIHYSDAGRNFFASKIAEAIATARLLE